MLCRQTVRTTAPAPLPTAGPDCVKGGFATIIAASTASCAAIWLFSGAGGRSAWPGRIRDVLMTHPRWLHPRWALTALATALATTTHAQGTGISAKGNTGGLVIPSAWVLESGTVAATAGNYMEPRIPNPSKRRNYSFGVGLLPYVELFGRFADYQYDDVQPRPGTSVTGPRDLSANLKIQLPSLADQLPDFAFGINDIGGAATYFKSIYGVASDQWGPVRWSAGVAHGKSKDSRGKMFHGVFGGVEVLVGRTGLSVLAEYDGQQSHAGVRYYSPELPWLGNAQLVGTAQRSFRAKDAQGNRVDATSVALSLIVPFGRNARSAQHYSPPASHTLPELDEAAERAAAQAPLDPTDVRERLTRLQAALVGAGLERVRVGMAGNRLVVEYENHRYAQNEADALGIVFGLAAENAPRQVLRVYAITVKAGQRQYETSISAARFRQFLRDGNWGPARATLWSGNKPDYDPADVRWLSDQPTSRSWARFELAPRVSSYVGTEVGAFDYSLAADWQALVPLWRGAEFYGSYVTPIHDSENFREGEVFYPSRQRRGVRAAHVSQAIWLHPRLLNVISLGQFNYHYYGAQNQTLFFVPGRADTVNLRLSRLRHKHEHDQYPDQQNYSLSYTLRLNEGNTWVEGGYARFVDGSHGPTLNFTRWFGDFNVQVHARRVDGSTTAGLRIAFPLTPRQGMRPYPMTFAGTSQFSYGVETRVSSSGSNVVTRGGNTIPLDYDADTQLLNRGRIGEAYFGNQLPRMREAFYRYAF